MDAEGVRVGLPAGPGHQHHRRRHQQRVRQRQHQDGLQLQNLQNLQDVTQEVPQGGSAPSARSVEVGRHRWQQQQWRGIQAQSAWPPSTPRPSSWSPTERAGRWPDQWQDRVRVARVTDTHQR